MDIHRCTGRVITHELTRRMRVLQLLCCQAQDSNSRTQLPDVDVHVFESINRDN